MPDIAMCCHPTCPKRTECHRHYESGTKPHKYRQWYIMYEPTINGDKVECDGYWRKERYTRSSLDR
jgi:hypothetical protein